MSKVTTGKSEYRERQEYRESYPGGGFHLSSGMAQAMPYIFIGLILIISMTMIGGWMFLHWWITDAWKAQWLGVLAVNTVIVCLVGYAIWWNLKVRYDRHEIWKRRQLAEIGVLEVQPRIIEGQADKGFNTEIIDAEGSAVRTVNPISIAAASKETNNYYGYDGEEDNDGLPQIEGSKTPTLSEQLQFGTTALNEATSIIGYMDGEPFRAKIFDVQGNLFNSVFVFGDQGYGKSTFGTYLAALTILQGGKLIVIDPESEADQSLTTRLGPLAQEAFLLCPIADTPAKAQTAVNIAKQVIERYGNNKLLVLIDEFTLIARQAAKEDKEWSDVGKEILDMSEEYATRGRKKGCRVICFGQIPKATRSGNTEVRDSMATVCFNLKKERAQNILELEDAKQAPSLKQGEIILMPNATTHRLQLPYPDEQGLAEVVRLGRAMKQDVEDLGEAVGHDGTPEIERDEDDFWSPQNQTTIVVESDEMCVVERHTGPLRNAINEPVEPLGTGPIGSPDDLTMNDLQIQQFEILYKALGNIKECLRRIDGCNNRHHRHASSIVKQKNLRRQ